MIVAQRITITVPDELHADLQRVKSKINVSKVCQEAIQKEVIARDFVTPGSAVERLRLEREKRMEKLREANKEGWYEAGYQDAGRAAEENITYDIYLYLCDCYENDILPKYEIDEWIGNYMSVPTLDNVVEEEGGWFYGDGGYETPGCYYRNGFWAGLREYWEYLRAELEGDKEGTAEENDSTDNS